MAIPLPFAYPPFVAPLTVPLTLFEFPVAYYLMLVCNLVLLGTALRLLATPFQHGVVQSRAMAFVAVAFLPLYGALLQGQLSFLALLLLILFVSEQDRGGRRGQWAELLCFKPSLAVVPFLLLAVGVMATLCFRPENQLLQVFAMILASPHLHTHHFVIGLIGVAIAVSLSADKYIQWATIAGLPSFIAVTIQGVFDVNVPVAPAVLLALFGWCACTDWGRVRTVERDSGGQSSRS